MDEPRNPFDRGAKLASRIHPEDFLALALPGLKLTSIRIEDAELTLPDKRSDTVFILDDEEIAACLEFMIVPDKRQLRSFHLKTAILDHRFSDMETLLAVFYLTPGGYRTLPDRVKLCTRGTTEFRFTAIPLWEHKDDIKAGRHPGLVPFLSLWSDGDPEDLELVRELILREPDPKTRADMLGIAVMLATRKFRDRKWLLEFFQKEWTMLKESWLVDEWIQEGIQKGLEQGRKQGLEQGQQQAMRQALVSALQVRFEVVPRDLLRALSEITESALLEQLLPVAIRAESLDEFREKMKLALGE